MNSVIHFFKYNNAFPIAVSVLLLGTASTYAYNNPETFVEAEDTVVSIDNTYIATVDFRRFSPTAEVLAVREDDTTYYVTYEFSTIALVDAVWQDVTTTEVLEVSKDRLGAWRDLGLYVTEELNEKIADEKKRLARTQEIERQQVSEKKVARKYSGIVGGFLSEDVQEFERYTPVVKPPKPKQEVETFARPNPVQPPPASPTPQPQPQPEPQVAGVESETVDETDEPVVPRVPVATEPTAPTNEPETTTGGGGGGAFASEPALSNPPYLTLLGSTPVRVKVGDPYTDLGATVADDVDNDIPVILYLNGTAVDRIVIDTTVAGTHSIVYEAIDGDNQTATIERVVEVFKPAAISVPPQTTTASPTIPAAEPDSTAPPTETPESATNPEPTAPVTTETPAEVDTEPEPPAEVNPTPITEAPEPPAPAAVPEPIPEPQP